MILIMIFGNQILLDIFYKFIFLYGGCKFNFLFFGESFGGGSGGGGGGCGDCVCFPVAWGINVIA